MTDRHAERVAMADRLREQGIVDDRVIDAVRSDPHEKEATMHDTATARDRIVVEAAVVDRARRAGEVLEVIGGGEDVRYRVRWDGGDESIVAPGPDARVVRG